MISSKKVYIVSSGEYSDYHICGVFSNRKIANQFIQSFEKDKYSEMGIETWELDPFKLELKNGLRPCFIRMDKQGLSTDFRVEDSDYGFTRGDRYGFDVRGNLYLNCYAKDAAHAIKIANDLRAQLIAENKWKEAK